MSPDETRAAATPDERAAAPQTMPAGPAQPSQWPAAAAVADPPRPEVERELRARFPDTQLVGQQTADGIPTLLSLIHI